LGRHSGSTWRQFPQLDLLLIPSGNNPQPGFADFCAFGNIEVKAEAAIPVAEPQEMWARFFGRHASDQFVTRENLDP
jgi:hypothetical protein